MLLAWASTTFICQAATHPVTIHHAKRRKTMALLKLFVFGLVYVT